MYQILTLCLISLVGLYTTESQACQVVFNAESFKSAAILPVITTVEQALGCTAVPSTRYQYAAGDYNFGLFAINDPADSARSQLRIVLTRDQLEIAEVISRSINTSGMNDEPTAGEAIRELVAESMPLLLRKMNFPVLKKDPSSQIPTGSSFKIPTLISNLNPTTGGHAWTFLQNGKIKNTAKDKILHQRPACIVSAYRNEMTWDDFGAPESRAPHELMNAQIPEHTDLILRYKIENAGGLGILLGFESANQKVVFICFEKYNQDPSSMNTSGIPTISQFEAMLPIGTQVHYSKNIR